MSKTNISIIAVLAILTLAEFGDVGAQSGHRAGSYTRPHKSRAISRNLTEGFYPIGWSRDGKLAYVVEPADDVCGCYFANLVIKDLKTDSVLWHLDYQSGAFDERDRTPKSFPAFWRFNSRLFSKKLAEYEISRKADFGLSSFPITYNGDELAAKLDVEYERNGPAPQIVSAIVVQMNSKKRGRKNVYENRKLTDFEVLDVKLLGYLKSPIEHRVALILVEYQRGFETTTIAKIRLVGSDLVTGFR